MPSNTIQYKTDGAYYNNNKLLTTTDSVSVTDTNATTSGIVNLTDQKLGAGEKTVDKLIVNPGVANTTGIKVPQVTQTLNTTGSSSIFTTIPSSSDLNGASMDNQGNLYISDGTSSKIIKITPAGVKTDFLTGVLNSPFYSVFDSLGNFYVTTGGNGLVLKRDIVGNVTTFASGMGFTVGIAIDDNDNLYVLNHGSTGMVYKVTPSGVVATLVSSLSGFPTCAIIKQGTNELYVSLSGANSIVKIDIANGNVVTFATGISSCYVLGFDTSGNLYSGQNTPGNYISKISPLGTVSPYITSGLSYPEGLCFDASNSMYIMQGNGIGGNIWKITQSLTSTKIFVPDANGNLIPATLTLGGGSTLTLG